MLVVDHDPEVTHLLATALERWGYIALQANSADEAIGMARKETVDAALIDVLMPHVEGFQVLRRLKEDDGHLVAMIMTSCGDLEGARRAMRLGAYDYITKPFDLKALRSVLRAGLKEISTAALPSPGKVSSPTVLTTSAG